MCYSSWYNVPTMLPASHRPATSWMHYTTSCNAQSSAPEDGQNYCPKHVELTGFINKPLLLHLFRCLYYLYHDELSSNHQIMKYISCCFIYIYKAFSED